jgi:S-DNA-T family DNA segregation ATPase FtsK/SpoIIIE
MAKKKKQTKTTRRRKQKDIEDIAPKTVSYFWRQVFAFFLIVVALFILAGGFGWGGRLPVTLFEGAAWAFGLVAYILPFVLIFLAVHKFRHEEYIIPFSKLLSSVLFMAALAAMLHVFVDRADSQLAASQGTYGGQIGNAISSGLLLFLNSITAFIICFFVTWLGFMLMFGISPKRMIAPLLNIFKKDKDTDLSDLNKAESEHAFKLHEGVPVEHHNPGDEPKVSPRMSSFKNSASKLAPNEDHAALTAVSDPDWKFPSASLLSAKQDKADPGDVEGNAEIIKESLSNFGIEVEMEGANVGPRVTQYTLKPGNGVKMSKIVGLGDNMAYDLAATSIRIEAPIPGKRAVGVEVPNIKSATVTMQSLISSKEWESHKEPLTFAVGKDIAGNPLISDLAEMPHMLVAGQTKSGKSVMINSFLTSLLYRNSPADLKLILVDPKLVEMAPYNDIPHLLTPVVSEPEKCISALKWAVAEMERRYRSLADEKVRNINEYNNKRQEEGMPYIVIVIDELADLMMMAARDVESLIVRIAQKARAVGIHLVLATQRPSVDVITGLIKANIPARLAFTVNSQVDSRTIIDMVGAEKLLGYGDMLYATPDMSKPKRVQGAFISTEETQKLTDFLRNQRLPQYDDEIVSMPVQLNGKGGVVVEHSNSDADDDMWRDAVRVVIENDKASTSLLQRRLRIGYGRASRIIDEMEERGVVGPADGARPREVLVKSMDAVFGSTNASEEPIQIEVSDDPRDEYLTR